MDCPNGNAGKWSQTLLGNDFVVLYNSTESFNEEFSSLFEGGIVEPNTVYKIDKLTNLVVLSRIQLIQKTTSRCTL